MVIVYMLAALLYGVMARAVLWYDSESEEHRQLFYIFLLLSFWTTCFAFAAPAPNAWIHLQLRKAAVIGWGTVFSFILHYALLVSGHAPLAKKRWVQALLIAPALINVWGFLLSPYADSQFNFVRTPSGWVSVYVDSFFNNFHTAYFVLYGALSVALIVLGYFREKDGERKRKLGRLLLAFGAALVLGALGDVVLHQLNSEALPQLGAVYTLIPAAIIFFNMRKPRSLLGPRDTITPPDEMLTEESRDKVYRVAGLTLAMLSYVNSYFVILLRRDYSFEGFFVQGLGFSALMLLGGETLFWMMRMGWSREKQERTLTIAAIVIDVILLLRYSNRGGTSIWAAIILYILVSVVFTNARLVLFVAGVHVALEVFLEVARDGQALGQTIQVDYMLRATLLILGALLAFYINRTYINRLKVNQFEQRYQMAVADVSSALLDADAEVKAVVFHALKVMHRYMHAHRTDNIRIGVNGELVDSLAFFRGEAEPRAQGWEPGDAKVLMKLAGVGQPLFAKPYFIKVNELQDEDPETYRFFKKLNTERAMVAVFPSLSGEGRYILLIHTDAAFRSGSLIGKYTRSFADLAIGEINNYLKEVATRRELNRLAHYDAMTGLYHRGSFLAAAEKALLDNELSGRLSCLLFMDIDMFKEFNDTMGHDAGDRILAGVAERLRSIFGPEDVLGRFGGDEFLILHGASNKKELMGKIQDLLSLMRAPMHLPQACLYLTTSVGVAVGPRDGQSVEELMNNADFAMYEAKKKGKNQFSFYTGTGRTMASYALEMKDGLRRAIDRKELSVFYQPQFSLQDGRLSGIDAQPYWYSPRHGRSLPFTYIHIASEKELIAELERFVIKTACAQAADWERQGLSVRSLSAACSAGTLEDGQGDQVILELVEKAGLPPGMLELNVPEEQADSLSEGTEAAIARLRDHGLRFAIGNFGREAFSLSLLPDLPFERIKLDRTFVDLAVKGQGKGTAILTNLLGMAEKMGIRTLAASLTREDQRAFLAGLGCHDAQGNLFCPPQSPEVFTETLRDLLAAQAARAAERTAEHA